MLKLFVDAAFQPKNKSAGIGIIIQGDNSERNEFKYFIAEVNDNHEAEFIALWLGLNKIDSDAYDSQFIVMYSDSQIVVDSVEKEYAKKEIYLHWLTKILKQLNKSKGYFINHSNERMNSGVDALAKQALNRQGKVNTIQNYTD